VTTIAAPVTTQTETKAALVAYLDALSLAESIQAKLWHVAQITLTQLTVLRELRTGPRTAGRLAELAGLSAASTSRLVDRLERRGLVRRRREHGDRRYVEVHLEPEGEKLLGEIRVLKGSDLHRAVESMTSEERRRLTSALTRLVELTRAFAIEREGRG
jgi:DNA-binding MarR family transcriptional regulator